MTLGVNRLLNKFGLVPKHPIPLGNRSAIPRPEKEY